MNDALVFILAISGLIQTFNLFIASLLYKRIESLDLALIAHIERDLTK